MTSKFAGAFWFAAVFACLGVQAAHAQQWQLTDGAARDVGVGANGAVWVIGTNPVPGGYSIWKRVNNAWVNVPGGAERIAVDPQGNAWVVNNSQNIFRHDGTKWVMLNGNARDVGVGANGTIWVIGNTAEAGGYAIYRSTDQGANWTKIPGSALRVSVDPQGNAWVVNNSNSIFRFNGSQWDTVAGSATDIGVGADGAVWVIGSTGGIFRRENDAWSQKPGGAAQIAAGPNGAVWVTNQGNQIYQAQLAAPAGSQALLIPTAPLLVPSPAPAPNVITLEGSPITLPAPTSNASAAATSSTVAVPVPGSTSPFGTLVVGGGTSPGSGTGTAPITVSGGVNSAGMIGPVGVSQATCGVAGKGLCTPVAAKLAANADVTCPSGSFPDLGRSACYSCPQGFTRSAHAVDNYKACQKQDSSVQGGFVSATFKGRLCDSGSFYDPIRGGECYSCPGGHNRSAAHIDAGNACYVPLHEKFSGATKHKTTMWPHECSSGTFWDGYNGGACYSCPGGFRRTANHITDGKACAQTVGESHARATLVKKAECGPGEIRDSSIQGTQDPAAGGGCWVCPTGTDRSILPITGSSACERAAGVQWASATRARSMTCDPTEIFDPISSGNPSVASALTARNAADPANPVAAKTIGGTCWTCPPGHKRTVSAVYSGGACDPPGIAWKSAPYNQPGLFGLKGAEAVALRLINERTVINTVIRDMQASGTAPANFAQAAWDQIAARPQESAVLTMAVFSRVVAAANNPAGATADERALLADVIAQIRNFRVFMAKDALDAYLAWKGNEGFRKSMYLQSQLQVMTDIGQVPPDFEAMTAEAIMASLGAAAAANTAIYMALSSAQVYKALFPYAVRAIIKTITTTAWQTGGIMSKAALAAATNAAASSAGAAMSAGPQVIVTFGLVVLQAAIEQQIEIANAEPKLRAGLATAQAYNADFSRLMATEEGSAQAQSYWSMLMAGPAPSADGSRLAPRGPQNLQAFAQAAAAAKLALAGQT